LKEDGMARWGALVAAAAVVSAAPAWAGVDVVTFGTPSKHVGFL
jgi:hypothetical protein